MIEANATNKFDGIKLLSKMPKESAKAVFFDPQYRGILDKMQYGNEQTGKGRRRASLTQMSEEVIVQFIQLIDRVLCKGAYLFLWLDKYELCEGSTLRWLRGTSLQIVDMIVWNKMRNGTGYRSRRRSEYLLVIQKPPCKPLSTWHDRSIPDVWEEKLPTKKDLVKQDKLQSGEEVHPHRKPLELQKRLILAVTNENDTVCDFASGSYSVMDACKETNRRFVGCDIAFGETWDVETNICRRK